jgi:predicted metal-dependent phosphotriesterase family hydrolase
MFKELLTEGKKLTQARLNKEVNKYKTAIEKGYKRPQAIGEEILNTLKEEGFSEEEIKEVATEAVDKLTAKPITCQDCWKNYKYEILISI